MRVTWELLEECWRENVRRFQFVIDNSEKWLVENEWIEDASSPSINELNGISTEPRRPKITLLINFAQSQTRSYDRYYRSNDYKSNIEWYHRRLHWRKIERQYSIENGMFHKERLLFDVGNDSFPWYSMDYFLEKFTSFHFELHSSIE